MYLSQTSLVLVMLLLLTSVIVYQSIDMNRKIILTEMAASDVSLKGESVEHVVAYAIPKAFNKALQDAELKAINDGFFDSSEEAKSWIENRTEDIINDYLANVSKKYADMGYVFTYNNIDINITGMPDGFTFTINYTFNYTIKKYDAYNRTITKGRFIKNSINVTVKSVFDAYEWQYNTTELYYISPEYFKEDADSPSILDRLANISTKNWTNGVGITLK
jgi:hypothetical protein